MYQQDEVRMKYIALGPCRPPLEQFPQRNCGDDLNTALQRRAQDIVNAVELIVLTKMQLEMLRQDDGWENFLKKVTSFL